MACWVPFECVKDGGEGLALRLWAIRSVRLKPCRVARRVPLLVTIEVIVVVADTYRGPVGVDCGRLAASRYVPFGPPSGWVVAVFCLRESRADCSRGMFLWYERGRAYVLACVSEIRFRMADT